MENLSLSIVFPAIVTIIGWGFTFLITTLGWGASLITQLLILNQNRKNQKNERELLIFKERLLIIRDIISASMLADKLVTQTRTIIENNSHKEDYEEIKPKLISYHEKILNLIYDPAFRSLQFSLPKMNKASIDDQLIEINKKILSFHMDVDQIIKKKKIPKNDIAKLECQGEEIHNLTVIFVGEISTTYANIDFKLRSE